MKLNTAALAAFLPLLIAASVVASDGRRDQATDDKVVLKSKDGHSELELPSGWRQLNVPVVQIAAMNPAKHLYAEVTTEDRRDFDGDIQRYAARRRNTFARVLGSVSWAEGRSITVNGNPAWQYEGRGTRGGSKAAFLLTIVQIDNDYHTVWVWCGQSHFDDDRAELEKIPQGLRSIRSADRTEHRPQVRGQRPRAAADVTPLASPFFAVPGGPVQGPACAREPVSG